MLELRNLSEIAFEDLIECLLKSFEGYFVKMPTDIDYWKERFKGARVDYHLSCGVFDQGKLVAFVVNGVGKVNGRKTAFNGGTGVLKEYRGQQLVDQIYAFTLPEMRKRGIERCQLEVIQLNERAIRVYQRIGFEKTRALKCYKGRLTVSDPDVVVNQVAFTSIMNHNRRYAWDNMNEAILQRAKVFKAYEVFTPAKGKIGYFVLGEPSGYIAQLESKEEDFKTLCAGIGTIVKVIKVNNVDADRIARIKNMEELGLENTIDQYEMEMDI
jgi:ribosomal protein S18 acetylase RimI-like enzyme